MGVQGRADRRGLGRLPALVVLALIGAGCGVSSASEGSAATSDDVEHVIAISVDGLNPDAIEQLGPEQAAAFHRLIDEGASTLNARTVIGSTRTLPNHTSMLTGRPVLGVDGHAVTVNSDEGGTVHDSLSEPIQSVFSVVHDHGGSTAFFSAKDKLDFLDRSWNDEHGQPDVQGEDNGTDKIDLYVRDSDADLADQMLVHLANGPSTLTFLHLTAPDTAGHAHGWMSEPYLESIVEVDRHIGWVLDQVASDDALRDNTVVLVTSDHGGTGESHEDTSDPANYTVPFFAWGYGVEAGSDLYELNADDRTPPGSQAPDYTGPQPVRNADLANTVTDLLSLPAVSGSVINAPASLDLR